MNLTALRLFGTCIYWIAPSLCFIPNPTCSVWCLASSTPTMWLEALILARLSCGIRAQNHCLCSKHRFRLVDTRTQCIPLKWWAPRMPTIWYPPVRMALSVHGSWTCWPSPRITWNCFIPRIIKQMRSRWPVWASLIMKPLHSGRVQRRVTFIRQIVMIVLEGE